MGVFIESLKCKHRWEMISADIPFPGGCRGNLYRCKTCSAEVAQLFIADYNAKARAAKAAPKQTSRVQRKKRKSVQR